MLRLVLLLVLANAGYFAWSQGLLAPYGFAPATQSEPQRLAQQIRPDMLRILTPLETRRLEDSTPAVAAQAPASAPTAEASSPVAVAATPAASAPSAAAATQCLQAGLFSEEQAASLRKRLSSALPAGSWTLERSIEPVRWVVYMGKYNSPETLNKKKNELRQLGVAVEPLNNPALEPGLSLGSFTSPGDADAALTRIAARGVRTARVVQILDESRGQKLKLAAVDATLRAKLKTIQAELGGKSFQACS